MQIQYTKNLKPRRFELGTTLKFKPKLAECVYYLVFEEPDDGAAQRTSCESLRLVWIVQESDLQGNGTCS